MTTVAPICRARRLCGLSSVTSLEVQGYRHCTVCRREHYGKWPGSCSPGSLPLEWAPGAYQPAVPVGVLPTTFWGGPSMKAWCKVEVAGESLVGEEVGFDASQRRRCPSTPGSLRLRDLAGVQRFRVVCGHCRRWWGWSWKHA